MHLIKEFPEIHTERLVMRELQIKDANQVKVLAGAYEIADTTLRIPHPYRLSDAKTWIHDSRSQWQAGKACQWAITLKSESTLIGSIGLVGIDTTHRHGELGYWVGKPWWNKGFATEAGRAVIKYSFERLHLHRIHAHHFARNKASGKVLQKLGMMYEGKLKEHAHKWDRYEDIELYGILNPGAD